MNAAMTGSRSFTYQGNIPERYRTALMAGIPFIELHHPDQDPERGGYPRHLIGFFNVEVVRRSGEGERGVTLVVNWKTGRMASITFNMADQTGMCIAFCPDDRFYHNRMMLVDNPQYEIAQMYTRNDGIVPGTIIKNEVEALKEVICERVPVSLVKLKDYKVTVNWFYEEQEAAEYLKTLREPRKYEVVPGEKWQKTEECRLLIKKYNSRQNGWTDCDEFRSLILPRVKALIEEKNRGLMLQGQQASNPDDLRGQVKSIIASLSPAEKRTLLADIVEIKKEEKKKTVPPPTGDQVYTRNFLKGKKLTELSEIAEDVGVGLQIDGKIKTKENLIEDILSEQQASRHPEGVPGSGEPQKEEEEEVVT